MNELLRQARQADTVGAVERPALPASVPGLFLRHCDRGFTAHVVASQPRLSTVRRLTAKVLIAYGASHEAAAAAQLVVSELMGNAVEACGDHVPLMVEVYLVSTGVAVAVHDPAPELLPTRRGTAMDSITVAVAVHDPAPELLPTRRGTAMDSITESGRGLQLLDTFAPGWRAEHSPIGKQIRCLVTRH